MLQDKDLLNRHNKWSRDTLVKKNLLNQKLLNSLIKIGLVEVNRLTNNENS